MPSENHPAAPAPQRRSSRPRTAAAEAPAAGATAATSEQGASAPLSRRAARARLASAEVLVAAAAVAFDAKPAAEVTPVSPDARNAVTPEADSVAPDAEPLVPEADALAPEIDAVVPEADTAAPDADSSVPDAEEEIDAFEAAARAFRQSAHRESTAAQPTARAAEQPDSALPDLVTAAHTAPRRGTARKFVALGATVGVMSLAGLLAVSMTLPAEAVAAINGSSGIAATSLVAASAEAGAGQEDIQAFVTSSDAQGESLARAEDFSTVSLVDLASEQGIKYSNELFTNDPEAAIQWPFLVGVGMSSGYGPRWGRMHEGIDFVPGEGAPIQAIADGTVRIATEQGGGYGVTVYIDHVIDGQVITSHYSHMQYGSLRVTAGQTVKVGDIVGLTGNTGHSFGAHLHFEIIVNGSTIDPLPWLRANAGRYSY